MQFPREVLVAHEQPFLAATISEYIKSDSRFTVAASIYNGNDLVTASAEHPQAIALASVDIQDCPLLDAQKQMQKAPIALISGNTNNDIVKAIQSGASGIMCTLDSPEHNLRGLSLHTDQEPFKGDAVQGKILGLHRRMERIGGNDDQVLANLTPRQLQVLTGMANGCEPQEIADSLGIALKTVEMHRKEVYRKLETTNLAEITKFALRNGVTSLNANIQN